MRKMGLEPTRRCQHMNLNHACLPIPALPQINIHKYYFPIIPVANKYVNQKFEKNAINKSANILKRNDDTIFFHLQVISIGFP